MPFVSAELKRLYELLIELGHPISPQEAARLFAAGELAAYVQAIIDMIAAQEVIKPKGVELYRVLQVARDLVNQTAAHLATAYNYLATVEWEYSRARDLMEEYYHLLQTWKEAEANYELHEKEINSLQWTAAALRRRIPALERRISRLYTEALAIQRDVEWERSQIASHQEDIRYWEREVRRLNREFLDCWAEYVGEHWYCEIVREELWAAEDALAGAHDALEDTYWRIGQLTAEKSALMGEINDIWNEINEIQAELAVIEDRIRELMGVIGDIDEIVANIVRYQLLYDYWRSEMFRAEAEVLHMIAHIDTSQAAYDDAVVTMKVAREAWNVFKAEHPVIAQEILDEWET